MIQVKMRACAFCGDERPSFALAEVDRPAGNQGLLGLAGAVQMRPFCGDRTECRHRAALWKFEKENT